MNKCHVQTFNDVAVCGMRRHNNVQSIFLTPNKCKIRGDNLLALLEEILIRSGHY